MIEINNQTSFYVDKKSFSQVAKKVLIGENKGTQTLSLAFVSKAEMQKLNKKFRKKNKPTDVLSFSLNEGDLPAQAGYLGEIVICPEAVKENEMIKVFIHGILHLLGYDHEKTEKEAKAMEAKQDFYLSKIYK